MEDFEKAFERAVSGTNRRAEAFAGPFRKTLDGMRDVKREMDQILASGGGDISRLSTEDRTRFDTLTEQAETYKRNLSAMAEAGQAEFERLGVFVSATFAAIVKNSGDAIGAIKQLEPAFKVLQAGVTEFGLTSTGAI